MAIQAFGFLSRVEANRFRFSSARVGICNKRWNMSETFGKLIRSLPAAAVFFATCTIGVPVTATPIASQFFGPGDFSASLEIVLTTGPGTSEGREVRGTNVSDALAREVVTGPPDRRTEELRGMVGGAAGLDLMAVGSLEGLGRATQNMGQLVLGDGAVRAGVTNKFIAVPRSGFSGTEAFIRFDVLTQGLLFADIYESIHTSAHGGSWVDAGVGLNVPGCPGCISPYRFHDGVTLGTPQHGVSDRWRFEGYIPVGVAITVDAGLSIETVINSASSPSDGFFSGQSGAFFEHTMRFGVGSSDPVDIVWASDLFFDRQPSVSDPAAMPEPATALLLLSGLIGVVGAGRRAGARTSVRRVTD
jgi:hypothetical protein